jgi:hypothetical protein
MLHLLTLLQINYTFSVHVSIMQNKVFVSPDNFWKKRFIITVYFLLFAKNIFWPIFLVLFLTVRPVAEYLGTTLGILHYSSLCHHGTPPVIRIWYEKLPNHTIRIQHFSGTGDLFSKFTYLVLNPFFCHKFTNLKK